MDGFSINTFKADNFNNRFYKFLTSQYINEEKIKDKIKNTQVNKMKVILNPS